MVRIVAILVVFSLVICGTASAKAPFKKALGLSACTDCHKEGDFKAKNSDNALYKAAAGWVAKIASDEKLKDKTCEECHQGKRVPEKKEEKK